MRTANVMVIGAVSVLVLTGCGGGEASSSPPPPAQAASSTGGSAAGSASTSAATAGGAPVDKSSAAATFGKTVTKDKVSYTVSAPVAGKPGASSVSDGTTKPTKMAVVNVTVKNDSAQAISPTSLTIKATSGGETLRAVLDAQQQIKPPTAEIKPGGSTTWKAAFVADVTAPIAVQVSMIMDTVAVFRQ
ncbi:DUF5067 domain-containing protein [Austwickia sp. TVS 96-490-7B]|uniref:DUF5067 domain-containing protein n=1 Tax=Austwickia sp. TVS 96-490-7B TaxID=2830843 RepID=UPI001C595FFD|nr:DUF5067 domain-containing protein [Austwickia sp. TVS 96-490-7B]